MAEEPILTGRTLLITGATGYLGTWLAEYARQAGADVRLLVRQIPDYLQEWSTDFEVVKADICAEAELSSAFRDCDLVWHAASMNETRAEGDMSGAVRTNVDGTTRVLQASVDAGVSVLVKFSTFHVYGHQGAEPLIETDTPRPRSVYGVTNLMGDEAALYFHRRHGLDVRIARVSNGYGAPLRAEIDRWSLVLNDLARAAFENKEIVLRSSGIQQRDFVSLFDVFDAACRLSQPDLQHPIFHVGGGNSISILDVARLTQKVFQELCGVEIPIRAPSPTAGESGERVHYDITRLRGLGYDPSDRMAVAIAAIYGLLEPIPSSTQSS